MRPDIEVTSFFNQVAAALDLTAAQKDLAWSLMSKSNVGRDDPTAIYFAILAKMDGLTSGMSADFQQSGAALVANMKEGLSAEMRKQLSALPASLSQKLETLMAEHVGKLAMAADTAITTEAARRQTFRLGGFALGAALLAVAATGGGYVLGRDAINAEAAKWSILASLPDGGKWLSLARMNDLDKAMAQTCSAGDGRVISGGKVCDLTMFVTPPVGTSKGVDYVRLSVAEYGNKLGTWGLLGLGGFLGLILGRLWKRKAY